MSRAKKTGTKPTKNGGAKRAKAEPSRKELVQWLCEYPNRPMPEVPINEDWAFFWYVDDRLASPSIITEASLKQCKTHDEAEKKEIIKRWKQLSDEQKEDAFQEYCEELRRTICDSEADGQPQDEQRWLVTKDGKPLDAQFDWLSDNWLVLIRFQGKDLYRNELVDCPEPFSGWTTEDLRELRSYLTRAEAFAEQAFATEAAIVQSYFDDLAFRVEQQEGLATREPGNTNKAALEILVNMTAASWKRDRDRLVRLLGPTE